MPDLPNPYYEDEKATLYKGDSGTIVSKMEPSSFDVIFTDPPYGVLKEYGEKKDKDTRPDNWFWRRLNFLLKPGGSLHFTCSTKHLPEWLFRVKQGGFDFRHTSVYWNMNRSAGNAHQGGREITFAYAWEPWLSFARNKEDKIQFLKRMNSDVFEHHGAKISKHPAERDIGAWRRMAEHFIGPGMRVLDPFNGTGTTLVVAKEIGAECVGIEREEKWCEFTKNRLAQVTLFEQEVLA